MKTIVRLSLGLALLGGLLSPVPAAAADCAAGDVYIESYDVDIRAGQARYRFGDEAEITVTITRKDTGTAVEGANVGLGLFQKDRMNFGTTESDVRGKATLAFDVKPRTFDPGPVTGTVFAYTRSGVEAACATVWEYGYKKVRGLFRVRG